MIESRPQKQQWQRHLTVIVGASAVLSIIAYGVWLTNNSNRASTQGNLRVRNASPTEDMLLRSAEPKGLRCPESHGALLQASQKTNHHRVILTWDASAPSADPTRQAVGYCLYRSGIQNVTKHDPKCSGCEQINQKPIPGTACVDDLVEDGAKYYYVTRAINANGEPSSLSSDTPAEIPATAKVDNRVATSSYPLCRKDNEAH